MSRIIIIVEDSFCSIDGVGYNNIDMSSVNENIHAVQWFSTEGWIEFKESSEGKPKNESITSIDGFKKVLDSWNEIDYKNKNPDAPQPPTAAENKLIAEALLSATDWTQLSSVSDPLKSTPYLENASAFTTYRNEVRRIAINPIDGFIAWPNKPTENWV